MSLMCKTLVHRTPVCCPDPFTCTIYFIFPDHSKVTVTFHVFTVIIIEVEFSAIKIIYMCHVKLLYCLLCFIRIYVGCRLVICIFLIEQRKNLNQIFLQFIFATLKNQGFIKYGIQQVTIAKLLTVKKKTTNSSYYRKYSPVLFLTVVRYCSTSLKRQLPRLMLS